MAAMRMMMGGWLLVLLGACVTIHIHFPAAAAERAADRIIEDVLGPDARPAQDAPPPPASTGPGAPVLAAVLDWLVPAAAAQEADLDISTPAIQSMVDSMRARHATLRPYYESGAVGLTADGLLALRDPSAVPLRERPEVNRLVAEQNRDRDALYREIARANGRPDWEPEIRRTFARRWIERIPSGWYYEVDGGWRQK